ncbi:MAG: putative Ig domain-containing protein [Verrucomicrobiaceae bacterium]|nr:putative Ig domain-containing protein [Verrucomicrobiaceae bacterium]
MMKAAKQISHLHSPAPILLSLLLLAQTTTHATELLNENFDSYTSAIPTVPVGTTTGIKAVGQTTAVAGISQIGLGGKVAYLNDVGSSSGQLELNAGSVAQTTLAVSFDIYNNATPSASGTQPINVGLLAWNSAVATAGGSSAKRIAGVTFNQFGSLTTPAFSVQGNGTVFTGTYDLSVKQSVKIYANDHDTASINYIGPDSVYRTLNANSFAVFLNGSFVITSTLNSTATDNAGTLLTGNSNLGRIGFNTSTTNLGSWLIDNVVISDMPAGVLPPAPAITSALTTSGQVGNAFTYQITASNSPTSFNATGLPDGLSINTTTGAITGTPTANGTSNVTISATNGGGTGSATLVLTVVAVPPTITSLLTTSGQELVSFSYQITASGSPTSFNATGLPAGLSVNTATGLISGTPNAATAGTYNVTISASNSGGPGSATLVLTLINKFDALRIKWMNTLIADVTSAKSTSSINTRASTYQTSMLYTVSAVKVINGGSGYTSAPNVTITGGNGSGATATATVAGGKVTAITVTAGGSGFTGTPSVNFSGGGGTGVVTAPLISIWSDLPLAEQSGVTADVASGNIASSFKRLEYMAQAYAIPACALYQNASLLAAAVGGLDWLTANVYTPTGTLFGNWYDWEIAAPQALNNAAVLLLSNTRALSTAQIATYVKAVYNYGPDSVNQKDYFWWGALTGANTSNAALTMAVQGILLGNNTTTVTRFWQDTTGHPVNPQTNYVISGSLLLDEAQGNLSGNNPFDFDGRSVFTNVTSGDGFYADGSFIFHFNIPYTGQYGQELVDNIIILVNLLYGSQWQITDPEVSNIYAWMTDNFEPLMYHGAMMDMVRGRAIASSGGDEYSVGAKVIANIREVAAFAPSATATALTAFADSPQLPPGQFHFPSMDRVVAHRDGFSVGVSMSSMRVAGYEINTTSPTNLKGWFTGAGVTYLYLGAADTQYTGDYWATVDWYHLPGTTAEMNATPADSVTDQSWAGGAQVDKTFGVAGMSSHPAGTTLVAKKSWFMLDDEIVCLGAGITCTTGGDQVDTTVENRRLGTTGSTTFNIGDTPYTLTSPSTWASPVTVTTGSGATWCALDGVAGYYFPNGASNLQAQFVPGSGAWTTINPTDSDSTVYTDYYLKLWFNHGVTPTNAKYAYVILPNRSASSVKAYAANPDVTILSNTQPTSTTTGIQAVKSLVNGVVAANFWAKTTGPDNGGTADLITVSKQCSVIVRETSNSLSIGVSDPTQSNTGTITVTLSGKSSLGTLSLDSGVTVTATNPITLSVSVNGSKGKSFNASFQLAPKPVINCNLNLVGATGSALSYAITATGSPTSYGATNLPPGLSINASTGVMSGTPSTLGTFTTTLSATNANGTGYATLTTTVVAAPADIAITLSTAGASTWTCPANVSSIQVECWGGGGAGGSAYRNGAGTRQNGGGGAGGAYANVLSYPVTSGSTYFINVGAGGTNSASTNGSTVAGGDSWLNSINSPSTTIIAKGGAGGATAVGTTAQTASGGAGTASLSHGDVVWAGGSGFSAIFTSGGGGGGSGASATSAGVSATSSTGAIAPSGGGNGGTGSNNTGNGTDGTAPGGGGSGASDASQNVRSGGSGGAGRVIITINQLTGVAAPTPVESWRQQYFGSTANSGNAADSADPDGDGLTNQQEYILGTLPTVASTSALLNATTTSSTITLTFTATLATGTGYAGLTRHWAIESTTDLTIWTPVASYTDITGNNQPITATLPIAGPKAFYRLKAWLQ